MKQLHVFQPLAVAHDDTVAPGMTDVLPRLAREAGPHHVLGPGQVDTVPFCTLVQREATVPARGAATQAAQPHRHAEVEQRLDLLAPTSGILDQGIAVVREGKAQDALAPEVPDVAEEERRLDLAERGPYRGRDREAVGPCQDLTPER